MTLIMACLFVSRVWESLSNILLEPGQMLSRYDSLARKYWKWNTSSVILYLVIVNALWLVKQVIHTHVPFKKLYFQVVFFGKNKSYILWGLMTFFIHQGPDVFQSWKEKEKLWASHSLYSAWGWKRSKKVLRCISCSRTGQGVSWGCGRVEVNSINEYSSPWHSLSQSLAALTGLIPYCMFWDRETWPCSPPP